MLLAINTASSRAAIALIDGKSTAEDSWQSQNNEAEKLMPAIHALLESKSKRFSDIKKVLAISGPGSFTGLRVGITVANTIAHLNKCPLYAIDTFKYHWNSHTKAKNKTALLIFAGKRGVYLSKKEEGKIKPPENINVDDLAKTLNKKEIKSVFGDITPEQKEKIGTTKFTESTKSFAQTISELDLTSLKPQKIIKPNYIKSPSITISKKTLV